MPFNGLEDGLYMIVCRSPEKFVDHYGILDIGNRTRLQGAYDRGPIVIHLTFKGLVWQSFDSTARAWRIEGTRVPDEHAAIERMKFAAKNPAYHLMENNCEQFARIVATAKRESKQLQAAGWVAGALALAFIIKNWNDEGDRGPAE